MEQKKSSFVHLHVHSEYSLLEACSSIKKMVQRASEHEQPALAITDNGNLFGAIEFYFEALSKNIKPIIGLDAYLAPRGRLVKGEHGFEAPKKIVLLAQDIVGYQSLCKLSTIGYQEGFYYKPRIDYEVLKQHNQNLIALTGGLDGDVPQSFLQHGPEKALEVIKNLKEIFSDRLYLEVNRTGKSEWEKINKFLVEASKITHVPIVATNDVHYIDSEDSMAQEVLVCIGTNRTLGDENRFKLGGDQYYLKDSQQMRVLFEDIEGACDRTLEIADRCNVKFKFKDEKGHPIYHLPTYPVEKGNNLFDEITRLSKEGLEKRFQEAEKRNEPISEERKPVYYQRLEYELSVIDKMGFNGYFLIVQDFIGWAKKRDIPVGPGRGSGAGSLVAYSLGITDLDPMQYNLIFERFLNPERISMPDFDVDFCQDRRQEVIDYVTHKYGAQSVSQIITFGKLKAKAAIRDVGRVLGMTFSEVDVIAKLIPEKLNITLDSAIEEEPRLRELMENDPKIDTLMNLARKIEGLSRHASIHAAGVIISDKNLVEHAPLYKAEGSENVVQYDMKHAEKIGLIKFDFLGLKTLTLIQYAIKLIDKNRNKKVSIQDISMKDPGIYTLMSRGDTAGIFQFEGDGISDLITKVQPGSFEDITAINALYRPGPMQMLDEYIGRKHGKIKVTYIFPELEEILKETYGIIVYQEQVQLIAAKIASYSLGEADLLRRAMGKKNAEVMAQQKAPFIERAKKNNFDEKKAGELFDLMAKFAEYGFNKSHAAAYCVVAAQTAWLKAYYPVEFFAAILSTEMSDTDKIVEYVKDAQKHSIEVKSPHVNYSEFKFTVNGDSIYFGLGAIKGVGESAVEAIVEAREGLAGKKFESLSDFFMKVDPKRLNKKVLECLIKAGALDGFGYKRAQLMASYSMFLEQAQMKREEKELGQGSLFSMNGEEETMDVSVPPALEWPRSQRLSFEKEVLGFYLSDHPLKGYERIMGAMVSSDIKGLSNFPTKARVKIGGLITSYREIITKKGTRMAFTQFEDLSDNIELILFPDAFSKLGHYLKEEGPILVEGTLEKEEQNKKILVDQITPLNEAFKKAKRITFKLDADWSDRVENLQSLMIEHPGEVPVQLELVLRDQKRKVAFEIEEPVGIEPSQQFFEKIHSEFGRVDFIDLV